MIEAIVDPTDTDDPKALEWAGRLVRILPSTPHGTLYEHFRVEYKNPDGRLERMTFRKKDLRLKGESR